MKLNLKAAPEVLAHLKSLITPDLIWRPDMTDTKKTTEPENATAKCMCGVERPVWQGKVQDAPDGYSYRYYGVMACNLCYDN